MSEGLPIRALLVEDNPTDALLLLEKLREVSGTDFAPTHVKRLGDAMARLAKEEFDVVILDLGLPDSRGTDTLVRLRKHFPSLPVVVLTGLDDSGMGIKVLQLGAQDYLVKGQFPTPMLGRSLQYAIERHRSGLALTAQFRTIDDERRRIARDLHDSLGQELAALSLNLGWIKRSVSTLGKVAEDALDESLALVKRCSQEIRDFSYLLYPPMLDESGLAAALEWLIKGFTARSDIQVSLDVPNDLPRWSRDVETALYRISQECLNNAFKHSGSLTAQVRIVHEPSRLYLEVSDQGRGIHMRPAVDKLPRSGSGIIGMRERMWELGGSLDIDSDERGTTVRAILPLEEKPPKRRKESRPPRRSARRRRSPGADDLAA